MINGMSVVWHEWSKVMAQSLFLPVRQSNKKAQPHIIAQKKNNIVIII